MTAVSTLPRSAEEFLLTLCDSSGSPGGAAYWLETALPGTDPLLTEPESLAVRLEGLGSLAVDPGPPDLLWIDQTTNSYRVGFPEAAWTWLDPGGRVMHARGGTVVQMQQGCFYWVELPVLGGGVHVSLEHRLTLGFMATAMVVMMGALLIWWVKRRYGAWM